MTSHLYSVWKVAADWSSHKTCLFNLQYLLGNLCSLNFRKNILESKSYFITQILIFDFKITKLFFEENGL